MDKTNRKKQKQHETKGKDSFLHWYERERRHSKLTFFKVTVSVLLLIVCVIGTQEWTIARIGDGASKYSEETYDALKTVIEDNIKTVEIDGESYNSISEKTLFEGVDHCTISYSKGEDTVLRCDIVDGFFTAEARIFLDSNYNITSSERNYHSVDEYLAHFWLVFRFMGYGLGIAIFLAITLLWNGSLRLIAFILKKREGKRAKLAEGEDASSKGKESLAEGSGGSNVMPLPEGERVS